MHSIRRVMILVLATFVAVPAFGGSTAAAGQACRDRNPYKVAIVGHFTTPVGTLHSAAYAGLEAYFESRNAAGGVGGRCVELVKRDGAGDLQRLTGFVKQQAADPDVLAIVGLGASRDQVTLVPEVESLQIPTILSPSSLNAHFTQTPGPQWVFGIGLDLADAIPQSLVRYVLGETPSPRVATFAVDEPSTRRAAEGIGSAISERGGEVVASEFVSSDAVDMRPVADKLVEGEPDWVIVTGAAPAQVQSLVTSLKVSARPEQRIIAIGAAGTEQFALADSDTYFATSPTAQASKRVRKAVAKVDGGSDALKNEDTVVSIGWITGVVLESALEACAQPCTRAALRDALEAVDGLPVGGLSRPVSLTSHQGLRAVGVYRWDSKTDRPVRVGPWIEAYQQATP